MEKRPPDDARDARPAGADDARDARLPCVMMLATCLACAGLGLSTLCLDHGGEGLSFNFSLRASFFSAP